MLNPKSPLPLYHQLADILAGQIRSGRYTAGEAIPSETAIAKEYHIGRPTVRQSMDILVRKGLLERRRGSGTFVREKDQEIDLFALAGTSQAFLMKGVDSESRLVEPVSVITVSPDETHPFENQAVFFFSRLTRVNGNPVLLEDFFLNPALFPGLEKLDLDNRSLSEIVSDQYYLKPESARQTFKLSCLSGKKAKFLGLDSKEPVLMVERNLNFPGVEKAIFSILYCRTDRFSFSQTIRLF